MISLDQIKRQRTGMVPPGIADYTRIARNRQPSTVPFGPASIDI